MKQQNNREDTKKLKNTQRIIQCTWRSKSVSHPILNLDSNTSVEG